MRRLLANWEGPVCLLVVAGLLFVGWVVPFTDWIAW